MNPHIQTLLDEAFALWITISIQWWAFTAGRNLERRLYSQWRFDPLRDALHRIVQHHDNMAHMRYVDHELSRRLRQIALDALTDTPQQWWIATVEKPK